MRLKIYTPRFVLSVLMFVTVLVMMMTMGTTAHASNSCRQIFEKDTMAKLLRGFVDYSINENTIPLANSLLEYNIESKATGYPSFAIGTIQSIKALHARAFGNGINVVAANSYRLDILKVLSQDPYYHRLESKIPAKQAERFIDQFISTQLPGYSTEVAFARLRMQLDPDIPESVRDRAEAVWGNGALLSFFVQNEMVQFVYSDRTQSPFWQSMMNAQSLLKWRHQISADTVAQFGPKLSPESFETFKKFAGSKNPYLKLPKETSASDVAIITETFHQMAKFDALTKDQIQLILARIAQERSYDLVLFELFDPRPSKHEVLKDLIIADEIIRYAPVLTGEKTFLDYSSELFMRDGRRFQIQ